MLNKHQRKLYDAFYESTHKNDKLDEKTELLVGLAAAMGMNCEPCTEYYLNIGQKAGINKDEISAVLAKEWLLQPDKSGYKHRRLSITVALT